MQKLIYSLKIKVRLYPPFLRQIVKLVSNKSKHSELKKQKNLEIAKSDLILQKEKKNESLVMSVLGALNSNFRGKY